MKVALFGASGFVGRATTVHLAAQGHDVVPFVRSPHGLSGERVVGPIEGPENCPDMLAGIDVVVNLAARVHMMVDPSADPLAEFRKVNSVAAARLARQARAAGVRRYIYLSSVKVNGDDTNGRPPFSADEIPNPSDPYGQSKLEAEQALREIAAQGAMDVAIIRPPLVYGPGVKANFRSMMKWLKRGLPLPLASIDNRRSLLGLDNLVDLIEKCLSHPGASNQIFMAGDGRDVSTPELLRLLAYALGAKARLVPVPVALLRGGARILGREAAFDRLGWTPPVTLERGLEDAAKSYLESRP